MAIKTFRVGKVLIEATQMANVQNASLAINFGNAEITAIGQDWRDVIALARGATLTVTAFYDPLDSATNLCRTEFMTGDGYLSVISIYDGATTYFAFSGAMVTACNINKSVGAADTINLTLVAKGTVTYTP